MQPFQAAGRRQRVTVQGGREPKWRDGSRELFYRAADGALMAVSIAERDGELVPGPPVRIATDLASSQLTITQRQGVLQMKLAASFVLPTPV